MRGAVFHRPVFHGVRHFVGFFLGELAAVVIDVLDRGKHFLGQTLLHLCHGEYVLRKDFFYIDRVFHSFFHLLCSCHLFGSLI